MYHALTTPGEAPSRYVISARRFAWQMRWLRLLRRRVVGLDEYLRCRREHRLPPARTVVITFDDGYVDNGEVAKPLLDRFGFPATIFLVTDYLGTANRWDAKSILSGRPLLGWDAVGALERTGLRFAAHSRRHPFLTRVERPVAEEEVRGSKAEVEAHLADAVPAFAYPHGDYDEEIREMVERAGFWGALTTRTGLNRPATPPFALRRVEIKGEAGILEFLLAIWVGDSRLVLCRRLP
jgi:peptidoglycan/xylan/chitin deacetylase (PgdA/CDA1 family)